MKVAIVSNQESQVGKSVLTVLLGGLFAQTQEKRAVIFSTGNLKSLHNQVNLGTVDTKIKTMNIYKALLQSASLQDNELLDYADRIGSDSLYSYDIFSSKITEQDEEDLFLKTLEKCNYELILVEVKGNLFTNFNTNVLRQSDAILYVFNLNPSSIEMLKEYNNTYDKNCVVRTGYVCQKYEPAVRSEKRIAKELGVNKKLLMQLPYNSNIMEACLDGELNSLISKIRTGDASVANLRINLLKIMQYLFDSNGIKYIKGVESWER